MFKAHVKYYEINYPYILNKFTLYKLLNKIINNINKSIRYTLYNYKTIYNQIMRCVEIIIIIFL